VTLFELFDIEQDGDLDIADLSPYVSTYDFVPKLVQSDAELISAECCIPDAVLSEIGECLSGPDASDQPATCEIEPLCTAGFSAPLEPGDWLYKVCSQSPPGPSPQAAYCTSWNTSDEPAGFECVAAHLRGHSLFELIDVDGDVDVDLADYAVLQRDIADAR